MNNKYSAILFLIISVAFSCKKESTPTDISGTLLSLERMASLPSELTESSGLVWDGAQGFWSMNDKGGKDRLYRFDSAGNLLQELKIKNASNVDWEDLAIDSAGNIFVADTGNNDNNRSDLKIYKLLASDLTSTATEIVPEIINFRYNNQFAFPPGKPDRHFDAEAMIVLDAVIHLFTKDRANPFAGLTNHYKIPESPDPRLALMEFSYATDVSGKAWGSITGAARSADGNKIALVSNRKCWVFSNFSGIDFFAGDLEEFQFNTDSQIEGVSFGDECTLYLTDEQSGSGGKNLYRTNICL